MIPLRSNEFNDGILRLLETGSGFPYDHSVNLRHVCRGQMGFLASLVRRATDHASQGGFHVEQRTSDIHQRSIIGCTTPCGQRLNEANLIEDDLARLAETKHRESIGDLFQRRLQAAQLGQCKAVAANEQIQTVLYPYQFLAKRSYHRPHGTAVRTRQLRPLLINHRAVWQCFVQAVLQFQRLDALGLRWRLGNIKQQVLDQLVRSSLVDTISTLDNEAL